MATEFDDKDLKNALNAWRESANKQAERPEWFWARQRARIESRMKGDRSKRMPSLAWAGIAATVALGVALMIPASQPLQRPQNGTAHGTQHQTQMSDHDLMQQLEQTMNSGVPDALQPASTLAQEMEQAYTARATSTAKERMP